MRPSILCDLLLVLTTALTCTMALTGSIEPDHSSGSFSIFPSPFAFRTRMLVGTSNDSGGDVDSGTNMECQDTLFRTCCRQALEALLALCSASQWTWQGLFQGFHGGGSNNGTCRQVEGWPLRSLFWLALDSMDPWVLKCKTRTLSFFFDAACDSPGKEPVETARSIKNRYGGGYNIDDLFKIIRSSTSIPYKVERQAKIHGGKNFDSTQDKWSQLHSDTILKALKSFDGDSDVGDMAVNTLLVLLKSGQEKWRSNKSLAKNVLCIVKMFASNMVFVQSNDDFQPRILQFMQLIQHMDWNWSTDTLVNDKYIDKTTQTATHMEDMEGLKNTVDQLREALHVSQEMIANMHREKDELVMEVKDRDSKLLEIKRLKYQNGPPTIQQRQQYHQQHEEQHSTIVTLDTSIDRATCITSSIPIPPPPPPPPSLPNVDNIYMGRKSRTRSSSRSSKYFHPLALNLNFCSLKSLHENTPSSPTSPISSNTSTMQTLPYQQTTVDESRLKQLPKITMKQFFWSKLPQERIQNTVWKEISTEKTIRTTNKGTYDSPSNEHSNNCDRQCIRQPSGPKQHNQLHGNQLVELDIVELEQLFKKTQGTKKHPSSQYQGPLGATKLRKQPLKTLLEFNRANNIAIMLARIKLSYSEIRDSIWTVDDHRLNVDNLMAIRQYIPTKEEIEILRDYDGDCDMLGNAEKYFKAIMNIPRLSDRIDCIVFRRKFHHDLQELLPELDTLKLAIDELRYSHPFKYILKTILAIGNHLNDHTIRGNAYGFHLDALLKMGDTKTEGEGGINLPTLLHYLVFFLSKTGQQVVTTFKDDVPHLEAAAQISPPALFASVKTLDGNLGRVRNELTLLCQQKPMLLKVDRFTESMKEFLLEAEPIIQNVKTMARDIQDRLKDLIMYYGEDPTLVKPQDFFSIICQFSLSFEKVKVEIEQARQRTLRQQQNANKKIAVDSPLPTTAAVDMTPCDKPPMICDNVARIPIRTVSKTEGRCPDNGFDQVLQELRAGLKRGDHSWRVEQSTKKGVSHSDGIMAVIV
ncbi:unnamed protein product [Absidia cylindrospora]